MKRYDTRRHFGIALLGAALFCLMLSPASVAAQSGPHLTDFHWGKRSVSTCDTCTKNDTVEYRGIVTFYNEAPLQFRIDSIILVSDVSGSFRTGTSSLRHWVLMEPGDSGDMEVFFRPCDAIRYDAQLRIYYTIPALGTGYVFGRLSGTGIESCIQVSDLSIEGEFDAVTPRSSRKRLHIRSTGTRPVTITDVSLRGDDVDEFALDGVVPLPVTIPVGDSLSFDVLFTPTRMESFVREVTVTMTGDFADVDCPGSCSDSVAAIRGIIATADVERTGEGLGGLSVSPNPAGGELHASVTLDRATDVRLRIYDAAGRAVASHAAGRLSAGTHRIPLDLSTLPSGIYLLRVGDLTERVVVVR